MPINRSLEIPEPSKGDYIVITADRWSPMKSKARIVRIGNSRGVRIPKALLEEAGLSEDVELDARAGAITIRPAKPVRAGWAAAARELAKEESGLLDPPAASSFDQAEWAWE